MDAYIVLPMVVISFRLAREIPSNTVRENEDKHDSGCYFDCDNRSSSSLVLLATQGFLVKAEA